LVNEQWPSNLHKQLPSGLQRPGRTFDLNFVLDEQLPSNLHKQLTSGLQRPVRQGLLEAPTLVSWVRLVWLDGPIRDGAVLDGGGGA
jgi:hypothetical protein